MSLVDWDLHGYGDRLQSGPLLLLLSSRVRPTQGSVLQDGLFPVVCMHSDNHCTQARVLLAGYLDNKLQKAYC
jgi:hypothetical protein